MLQVLIAATLLWNNHLEFVAHKPKPILDIDWASVDKLTIEDTGGGITLIKSNSSWSLSNQQLPVSAASVEDFLRNLESLKTGWPVATLSDSHERFKVSDRKFVRRVELFSNNVSIGKLLFGSSIGLRQSNVRQINNDTVYNVKLDTLDISANVGEWFNKSLIAADNINMMKAADYRLKRTGASWEFDQSGPSILLGRSPPGRLDQNKAAELDQAFSSLKILKISSFDPDARSVASETLQVGVTDAKGKWIYTFIKSNNSFYVTRSDREEYFTLDQAVYEKIAGTQKADLIISETESISSEK
jgi:hypothetical protein